MSIVRARLAMRQFFFPSLESKRGENFLSNCQLHSTTQGVTVSYCPERHGLEAKLLRAAQALGTVPAQFCSGSWCFCLHRARNAEAFRVPPLAVPNAATPSALVVAAISDVRKAICQLPCASGLLSQTFRPPESYR